MAVQRNDMNEESPLLNASTHEDVHPLLIDNSQENKVKTKRSLLKASLNIAKMCMGTGTLALPFGASEGGLLFNVIGLILIGLWNIYSMDRLISCLDYISSDSEDDLNNNSSKGKKSHRKSSSHMRRLYKRMDSNRIVIDEEMVQDDDDDTPQGEPPKNTATFGKVAWYVFGSPGLWFFDTIMMILMLGIIVAYQDAVIGFLEDTPLSTKSLWMNAAIVSLIFIPFCWVSNLQSLAKLSAFGILTIMAIFIFIAGYGIHTYGLNISSLRNYDVYWWPQNLTGLSNWFGIVVFGYGFVPFTYNIHESMDNPTKHEINKATRYALFSVVTIYALLSVSIPIIYAPSPTKIDGDVLQLLPHYSSQNSAEGWMIPTFVRLAMIVVIVLTAPLIVVPTGELIQGKLGLKERQHRFIVTAVIIALCGLVGANLPNFVHVISFLGCVSVGILSFVCPPLFHLILLFRNKNKKFQETFATTMALTNNNNNGHTANHTPNSQGNNETNSPSTKAIVLDVILLIWGISASIITSIMTCRSLINEMKKQ